MAIYAEIRCDGKGCSARGELVRFKWGKGDDDKFSIERARLIQSGWLHLLRRSRWFCPRCADRRGGC